MYLGMSNKSIQAFQNDSSEDVEEQEFVGRYIYIYIYRSFARGSYNVISNSLYRHTRFAVRKIYKKIPMLLAI